MQWRRVRWLVGALVLLLVAAWVFGRSEPPARSSRFPAARFPRAMDDRSRARAELRRITGRPYLPRARRDDDPPRVPTPAPSPAADPSHRDLAVEAMAALGGRTAMVLELNALANSRVGELLLRCLAPDFERLKKESGIDASRDLDRLLITEHGAIVSGLFSDLVSRMTEEGVARTAYGQHGTIVTPTRSEKGSPPPPTALWRDELIITGETEEHLRRTIDVLEGRLPASPSPVSPEMAYGEAYGILTGDTLRALFPVEEAPGLERLLEAARQAEVHLDARDDVAMVIRVDTTDEELSKELVASLRTMLRAARIGARASRDELLQDLLSQASIVPEAGGLRAEVAVPFDVFARHLGGCGRDSGHSRRGAPPEPGDLPAATEADLPEHH